MKVWAWIWQYFRSPEPATAWELLRPWRIILFFVLFGITWRFGHLQIFTLVGERSQEAFLSSLPSKEAKRCHLVTIGSDEYKKLLGNGCMSPDTLAAAVEKILSYRPAVVVVDFDTSADAFESVKKKLENNERVILARDAYQSPNSRKLLPASILGGINPEVNNFGYALFPRDSDWTIRRYEREIVVDGCSKPTLYWKAVQTFRKEKTAACKNVEDGARPSQEHEDASLADLRYHFPETPLSDILALGAEKPPDDNSLAGKIVIFGGRYSASDRHSVGGSEMSGMEIVAAGIEHELDSKDDYREASLWLIVLLKVLIGVLIVASYNWLRPVFALFSTVIVLSISIFIGTFAMLHFANQAVNFMPFLVAIWIEQLVEGTLEAEKKHTEPEHSAEPC